MSYTGQPRSSENKPTWFNRRRQIFDWSAIVTISISRTVSETENRAIFIALLYLRPPCGVIPSEFCAEIRSHVTANWNDKLSGFGRIYTMRSAVLTQHWYIPDGQTKLLISVSRAAFVSECGRAIEIC